MVLHGDSLPAFRGPGHAWRDDRNVSDAMIDRSLAKVDNVKLLTSGRGDVYVKPGAIVEGVIR